MKRTIAIILSLCIIAEASAQNALSLKDSGADEIVRIWDNSTAPHSNFETKSETIDSKKRIRHTSSLDLYIYRADPAKATGQSVVIFPGGGYRNLGFGSTIVRFYLSLGLTVAVSKYRLPNYGGYEATLEDGIQSVRYMRENAERLGIDPRKIGVSGNSAGGHLASWVSNRMPGEEPAFAILLYPACVRSGWYIGEGPIHLMGDKACLSLSESLDTPPMVNENTPPTIILHSDDDDNVPVQSAIEYYKALKRYGIPSSLHIYPSGKHGWCGSKTFRYKDEWRQAVADFISICNTDSNKTK